MVEWPEECHVGCSEEDAVACLVDVGYTYHSYVRGLVFAERTTAGEPYDRYFVLKENGRAVLFERVRSAVIAPEYTPEEWEHRFDGDEVQLEEMPTLSSEEQAEMEEEQPRPQPKRYILTGWRPPSE